MLQSPSLESSKIDRHAGAHYLTCCGGQNVKRCHPRSSCSEKVTVHRCELELVLGTEDGESVPDCLLDLRLETRVLLEEFVVRFGTEFGMIVHVFNLFLCCVA